MHSVVIARICQRLCSIPALSVARCSTDIIDRSRVPKLEEKELEETFVRGWGPGGQSVQKTNNCVVLKHIPTGTVVKCHMTRSLSQNQKHARLLMVAALDRKLNGDMCIAEQEKRLHARSSAEKNRRRAELREKKAAWKKSLEKDDDNKDL